MPIEICASNVHEHQRLKVHALSANKHFFQKNYENCFYFQKKKSFIVYCLKKKRAILNISNCLLHDFFL